jgi:hypothetical protein
MPATASLVYHGSDIPLFQKDQNNCVYIISKSKQIISFQFALHEKQSNQMPISADTEKIIFARLTEPTQKLLTTLQGKSAEES